MKALVYTEPNALSYRDVDDPSPEADEVVVKVESVGICGSDMHAYLGHDERRPAPLILGHEAAGTVVGGSLKGKRVTLNPLRTCGSCKACVSGRENLCPDRQIISLPPREGAFAQSVAIPEKNLVLVPDGVAFDQAALVEPMACSWHAVRLGLEAAGREPTELRALVIGGGAIGFSAALGLKAQGVGEIVLLETNPRKREFLSGQVSHAVVAPEDLAADDMFDLVVDGVGFAATRATASRHALPGGVISHIGLGEGSGGLDIRRMTLQEITFIGTYTFTAQDFRDTAAALFDGRLGACDWIEKRPLAEGGRAFSDILDGVVVRPKIILKPN